MATVTKGLRPHPNNLAAGVRAHVTQIGGAFSAYMLVCGLIYSFTYYMRFGVNVFEFASIDFYVRAALIGSAGLFIACAVLFTALFVRWLSRPDLSSSWLSWVAMVLLTFALPFGVGRIHAYLVREYPNRTSPYLVKIVIDCEKHDGGQTQQSVERCCAPAGCSVNLVGVVGDRVVLYDPGQSAHQGQATFALRNEDVRSIEWGADSIRARPPWWCPLPCPRVVFGDWLRDMCCPGKDESDTRIPPNPPIKPAAAFGARGLSAGR